MTTLPSNPDELLDLIEDIIFVDLQDFSQLQLHDMARIARHIARAAEEASRRRDRSEADHC